MNDLWQGSKAARQQGSTLYEPDKGSRKIRWLDSRNR